MQNLSASYTLFRARRFFIRACGLPTARRLDFRAFRGLGGLGGLFGRFGHFGGLGALRGLKRAKVGTFRGRAVTFCLHIPQGEKGEFSNGGAGRSGDGQCQARREKFPLDPLLLDFQPDAVLSP